MRELLLEVAKYILENQNAYIGEIRTHLSICFITLFVSCAIGIPVGALSAKRQNFSNAAINLFNSLRMIPSLAILMAMIPLLGIGFRPALIALSLHAIPVIIINTYAGFKNISPVILESASGMGLSETEILTKIEFPLALPLIAAGIRTSMVDIVASATLAAYIGAGGLGVFIVSGLSFMNFTIMMTGGLSIAVIAVIIDVVLGVAQKKLIWYQNL
jgi:osmoprotectant transport system permease protein